MEAYPRSILELERLFSREEDCRQYLYCLRWPNGFICPRCQGKDAWQTQRGLYLCESCRQQISVTAGTIFQDSRLPLTLCEQGPPQDREHSCPRRSRRHVIVGQHAVEASAEPGAVVGGPAPGDVAQHLRELGVRTYQQIAELDPEALEDPSHALAPLKARILRDRWIEQAASLFRH